MTNSVCLVIDESGLSYIVKIFLMFCKQNFAILLSSMQHVLDLTKLASFLQAKRTIEISNKKESNTNNLLFK